MTNAQPYSIAIAGSTSHTVQIAQALAQDPRFQICWVLTPEPKVIGRKQVLTSNPLELWAHSHNITTILVQKKIDSQIKEQLHSLVTTSGTPDFLMVVDFGYLVPKWLLELPKIAPLNIHPSLLPRWRGSSPGQFVLLYGEKKSAVTLMEMGEGLDTGPILYQHPLEVQPLWTQTEYYFESFAAISQVVTSKIIDLATGTLSPQPQPEISPTPIARRLSRDDGFVSWSVLQTARGQSITQNSVAQPAPDSKAAITSEISLTTPSLLLQEVWQQLQDWPTVLANATKALSPWPGLWTIVPLGTGSKRLKILKTHLNEHHQLQLDLVQWEGQQPIAGEKIALT